MIVIIKVSVSINCYIQSIGRHGGSMVNTVASQQDGSGFDSQLGQALSVWSLRTLPEFRWVSTTIKKLMLGLSPVSTLDRGTG